jgi:hypothetical protein
MTQSLTATDGPSVQCNTFIANPLCPTAPGTFVKSITLQPTRMLISEEGSDVSVAIHTSANDDLSWDQGLGGPIRGDTGFQNAPAFFFSVASTQSLSII